jgi:hypothetical protein
MAPILVLLLLAASSYATLISTENFASVGTINISPDLAVFSDKACITPLTYINWGTLNAGDNKTQLLYIKNVGSGAALTLNMSTTNYAPSNLKNFVNCTWNREGFILLPNAIIDSQLNLTVSPNIYNITSFNFNIALTGTT